MISFIPKKDEGNARAGVRAAAKALLVLLALPAVLIDKCVDILWRKK